VERQIRRLALALAILFAILFAQLNWIQVFAASSIFNNPANEKRRIIQAFQVRRGEILARDGHTVLATSIPTNGQLKFLRRYPHGPLYAHVTGFASLFQTTRLESTYNDFLSARATELLPSTIEDEILDRPKRGGTVVTTIDPKLQQAAFQALNAAQRNGGAVAAMDPRTGEVLALVSIPSFDPNPLVVHDGNEARTALNRLHPTSGTSPLLSDATDQLFPPGSTFKMVDTAAALESGLTPQSRFPNPAQLSLPQTTHKLSNFGGEHCAGGASTITLEDALVESCNVTFAEIGLKLGTQALLTQASKFGFDGNVPFDIPFAEGRFPTPAEVPDNTPGLAFSAIGQQDVSANPLQMCLVASAIANGGVEMQPHLAKEILDPQGATVKTFGPTVFGRAVSARTAAIETHLMEEVVQRGTGTAAQIPGVSVAGKTGTAQTPSGSPHAWFVAFAPAQHPRIAVAVVVLNGGSLGSEATGGQVAAPVARAVIEAALGRGG
jgi:peptidoglycan glycosyltransferase